MPLDADHNNVSRLPRSLHHLCNLFAILAAIAKQSEKAVGKLRSLFVVKPVDCKFSYFLSIST